MAIANVGHRRINTVFHADLSDAHPGEDYWVSVQGKRIPLVPHTPESLAKAIASTPRLSAGRLAPRLTHYSVTSVALPVHSAIRVHLRNSQRTFKDPKSETGVSHCAMYIPPQGKELEALAEGDVFNAHPIDYVSTAQTFLFHHQDLITQDPALASIIVDQYMIGDVNIATAINNLALLMRSMGQPTENGGWATLSPVTPPYNAETGFDGKTTYYNQIVSEPVTSAALTPLSPLLVAIQNDPSFKNQKWTVTPGASIVPAGSDHKASSQKAASRKASSRKAASPETELQATGDDWNAAVGNTGVSGFNTTLTVADSGKQQVTVAMENNYIRYLTAYVRFYDAGGNAISLPNWTPDDAGITQELLADAGLQYDDVRVLGYLSPVNNVLGIPVGPAGSLDVTFTFPQNAVSASIYGSGIGIGANPWPKTPVFGGVMTGVFNLGVPAFMLGFGVAAQTYYPLYKILDGLAKNKVFIGAALTFAGGFVSYVVGSSVAQKQMNWSGFTTMVSFIFNQAATKALLWVEGTLATEEVAEQIPFAGWIMLAINIATGIAQMAETIVEVATSDWNIENKIASTITTTVTVGPDPRNKSFPQGRGRSLVVKLIYQDQARPTVSRTIQIADDSTITSYTVAFPDNTLGGKVKLEADFYVGTWLAGKATTGLLANDAVNAKQVDMLLVEYPVPLTSSSIYSHASILTYNNNSYGFTASSTAPTATIASRNTSPVGNALGNWTGLALSQRTGMLGPSWQAAGMGIADCATAGTGQLYAFMNLDIPGVPMMANPQFPSCGFTGQSRLIYDPYPPKFLMKDGQWVLDSQGHPVPDPTDVSLGNYYVDPRSANLPYDQGGGFHLRAVTLNETTPFNMSTGQLSYGRFAYFPDSVALHPSGLIIGVSARYQKLQIVTLNKEGGVPDNEIALGAIGSGPAQDVTRPGLMYYPVAVTCAYDGTIIVLEDTKSSTGTTTTVVARLSAYDLQMNPVNRFFDQAGKPSPWLYLGNPDDTYYLDLSAVGDDQMTYIYVLYYTGTGASPSDYNMAIYTYGLTPPTSNPLVTTNSIAAARLAVDMWHSAYTLNFAPVMNNKGDVAGPENPTTGPGGRTVPSISLWLPPPPTA